MSLDASPASLRMIGVVRRDLLRAQQVFYGTCSRPNRLCTGSPMEAQSRPAPPARSASPSGRSPATGDGCTWVDSNGPFADTQRPLAGPTVLQIGPPIHPILHNLLRGGQVAKTTCNERNR